MPPAEAFCAFSGKESFSSCALWLYTGSMNVCGMRSLLCITLSFSRELSFPSYFVFFLFLLIMV